MRRRPAAILAILLASGSLLLAWSQAWFVLSIDPGSGAAETLALAGDAAAPALIAIALAVMAVAAVLALAGPRLRVVLAAAIAILGVGAVAVSVSVLADPSTVFEREIAELTGLGGAGASSAILAAASTIWPVVAIIGGAATAVLGVVVAIVSRHWRSTGRRYERGTTPADPTDSVAAWDAISGGGDPTAELAGEPDADPTSDSTSQASTDR